MFSIRVHLADNPGHSMYECREYDVILDGAAIVIRMQMADGQRDVLLRDGGLAFVMGDSGKTVEVVRSRVARPAKVAELRGV